MENEIVAGLTPNTRIVLDRHKAKIRKLEINDKKILDNIKQIEKIITNILIGLQNIQARESRFDPE